MTALRILAIVVVAFLAYAGVWQYQYSRAESDANGFCDAVTLGADIADVIARTGDMKAFRHGYREERSRYVVTFPGPIFNAFVCDMTLAGGKVSAKQVTALDD